MDWNHSAVLRCVALLLGTEPAWRAVRQDRLCPGHPIQGCAASCQHRLYGLGDAAVGLGFLLEGEKDLGRDGARPILVLEMGKSLLSALTVVLGETECRTGLELQWSSQLIALA